MLGGRELWLIRDNLTLKDETGRRVTIRPSAISDDADIYTFSGRTLRENADVFVGPITLTCHDATGLKSAVLKATHHSLQWRASTETAFRQFDREQHVGRLRVRRVDSDGRILYEGHCTRFPEDSEWRAVPLPDQQATLRLASKGVIALLVDDDGGNITTLDRHSALNEVSTNIKVNNQDTQTLCIKVRWQHGHTAQFRHPVPREGCRFVRRNNTIARNDEVFSRHELVGMKWFFETRTGATFHLMARLHSANSKGFETFKGHNLKYAYHYRRRLGRGERGSVTLVL